MLDFNQDKFGEMIDTYLIPWGINIALALVIFIVGKLVANMLVGLLGKALGRSNMDNILVEFIQAIARALLLIIVIIAALNQLGVDTTSFIAILGAAGLAIGLALQGSLQNFAAGFMLLMNRPFAAGHYVEAGGTAGVVESIGIFTTVMTSPDNKEIVVPNGQIYNGHITNYSKRDTRRVDLVFGISYGDDLLKAKQIMMDVVKADERVLEDPAPNVAVNELADSSVNFIVRPWVKTEDYWPVKWDMTEKMKLALDENGITIPFPQMDVHVDKGE